ncbi:MAG TPA: hypothetical protein VNT29_10520 [Candidatus Limnocylindrales bacterium]|nr:hypothetical protein [Candidatus Limnocylindrales bacterium]
MKQALSFVGVFVTLGIGAVSLFWVTRPACAYRGELVVDPDIDHDDPGVDLDEDERHL